MAAEKIERRPRNTARAVGRVLAMVLAAGLLLAGCGTVPGAAVQVDSSRISDQTLHNRTDAVIAENPSAGPVDSVTRAGLNRYQLTDIVRHQLVLDAAKAKHVTVTDAQVNAFVAQNGGATAIAGQLKVPAADVPTAIYDYLVLQKLVDAIPAAGVDVTDVTVSLDIVTAADRDAAVAARAKYLADPAALSAAAAAAQSTGQESLLKAPQDAMYGIFSASEGDIVLVPQGAQGYAIARITKRTQAQAKLTKATVQSAQSLDGYLILASLLLSSYPAAKDVTVNPRYGQWDPATLQVIAPNSGL